MKVTIVDYGTSNLKSVCRGLAVCGADMTVATRPEEIENAEIIVLPGVGAYGDCARRLRERNLEPVLQKFFQRERPFLGICVGMQLLLDSSTEYGPCEGLGKIPGQVREIPRQDSYGKRHVPHIGWEILTRPPGAADWKGTLLDGIDEEDSVYFVHSYTAWPDDESDRLADAYHDGSRIAAVLNRGAVYGCQFHPEKSGPVGLKILSNFLNLV